MSPGARRGAGGRSRPARARTLTFHHAAQELAGPAGRPGHRNSPGAGRAVFSGGRSCRGLQRCPCGAGRVGVELVLPLLQRRLALLLHHLPARDRRHRYGSSSASECWAPGPEPWTGPRLPLLAAPAPALPPPPFPLPRRRDPNARMRRAAAPERALCQLQPQPQLRSGRPPPRAKLHLSFPGGGWQKLLSSFSVNLSCRPYKPTSSAVSPRNPEIPAAAASTTSFLFIRTAPAPETGSDRSPQPGSPS